MAVTAEQVLAEIEVFIPSNNVLTEAQMLVIIQTIIDQVGDDDSNLAEIKCKSLEAIGIINLSKATSTISTGLKKEKVGNTEVEYFGAGQSNNGWQDFLDSLKLVCPLFGYYGLSSGIGIKITPGCPPKVNPCCDVDDLEF